MPVPISRYKPPSTSLSALIANYDDDPIVCDTGAGRGLKRTMRGLTNPAPANARVTWGDGSTTDVTQQASLPDEYELPPFLVNEKVSTTLVSIGSNAEGTSHGYTFFDKYLFRLHGLQVYKDENGKLAARFVGPKENRVKFIGTKPRPGGVYLAPTLDVFKKHDDGAWRFSHMPNGAVIAGATTTPSHTATVVESVFTGFSSTQCALLAKTLHQPDYVDACEYTVGELNAHQEKMALQLIRKHNQFGHVNRTALQQILSRSHVKSDRDLARHTALMPICNHCLFGKNRKGAKHTSLSTSPEEPASFMQNIAVDNGGKENIRSMDGFWYPLYIICMRTSFTWIRFLFSTADSTKSVEAWLREVPKQHLTFKVKTMRHDKGRGDFGNKAFEKMLKKYSITPENTATSTGNAKCERRIGIAHTDSITNMSWCQGPRNWWSFSKRYSVTTRNLMPSKTNSGHLSPYEAAYGRQPNLAMLVPFGCLAYATVANINRGGKTNYRKASRICAMIGYDLKPDGHPLGYQLYDCDLGTIIRRADNMVKFNVDMPALKFLAERSVQRPVDLYKNAVVAKYFDVPIKKNSKKTKSVLFWGKVVSHRYDTDSELLFQIHYEDGDTEEMNIAEMMIHTRLAAKNDRGHDFTVPAAKTPRKKRKLASILQHAKNTFQPTAPNTSAKDASLSSLIATLGKPAAGRSVTWSDVLKPRISNSRTTTSLPLDSPMVTKAVCDTMLNCAAHLERSTEASDVKPLVATPAPLPFGIHSGHVLASSAVIKNLFDLSTEHGRHRQFLRQAWTYTIACGAMVEPPPSDIPEILVTSETKASSIPLPKSYREAVTGPYRRYWIEAIRVELENLLSRKVWREERKPDGCRAIPGKYVWKVKPDDKGNIRKWKARWIVQGFRQRAGHDYDKTFASVANIVTVRCLLAIACELGWEVHQMDVRAAYLCTKIEEHVKMYIKCPDGYSLPEGLDARLLGGLYGTKQGGALWAALRTKVLKRLGYTQSLADPSLYTKTHNGKRLILCCIVDDFVITGHKEAILEFKTLISKEWEMTDEGRLFWCLNLRVTRDMQRGLLKVDQGQYVQEILQRFSMETCNPRQLPMVERPILSSVKSPDFSSKSKSATSKTVCCSHSFPYASALGCLLYLRLTRPDALVAISILARFLQNPLPQHWTAVKELFKYLKGSINRGLLYRSSGLTLNDEWTITLWVDSDYATSDPDTRRSRAGYLGYLNKNLVTFNSALQRGKNLPIFDDGIRESFPGVVFKPTAMDGEPLPSMATNTCAAEYMALSLAVKEIIWLYMLLKTMGIKIQKPIVVYEDNRSTMKIATNATALKRTKSIDIRHHFLREHVEQGTITIKPISTAEQRADIMTKVLGKQLFMRFRDMITSDIDLTGADKRTCAKCARVFPSRNKLFKHLKCCLC